MRMRIIPQYDAAGKKLEYFTPVRAHDNDAGADIRTPIDFVLKAHDSMRIETNFGLDIPDTLMAINMPKSGQCAKKVYSQIPPIDSGYSGNIGVYLFNSSDEDITYHKGDKIAQIVIIPVVLVDEFTEDYNKFERGDGKEGSTGK